MPFAFHCTSTSCGPGSSTSTSSITSGFLTSYITAAVAFIPILLPLACRRSRERWITSVLGGALAIEKDVERVRCDTDESLDQELIERRGHLGGLVDRTERGGDPL